MKQFLLVILSLIALSTEAQTYTDSLLRHRQQYKQEFLTDAHSPLKAADTSYLRFFAPDASYRVVASFTLTPDAKAFDMPTHSGKTKKFRQYGIATFTIHDTVCTLQVFQNLTLTQPEFKELLFIPFTDATTYTETYGGGRYIDLYMHDIRNGQLVIDFNTCYNPYCAYAGGYNCPIPPVENRLPVAIAAGEKLYGKPVKE